jgi:hypothetical protein
VVSPCPDRDGYRSPQRASVIFIKMMRIYLFERLFHKQAFSKFSLLGGSGEGMLVSPQIGGRQCRAAREVHPFALLTMRLPCSGK